MQTNLLRIGFLLSIVATAGSLYFSEALGFPPCVLCWYQRICMYPLVVIYFVALWSEDKSYSKYTLPLLIIGGVTAVYHNLLYYDIIPDSITPCTQGISCTTKQIEWLGFITIPLLSLVAFVNLLSLEIYKIWRFKK